MSMTVRDVVHGFLAEQGVTTIFGNPGSTEMRFFRNWPANLDYVLAPQESSVLAMADGWAQAKGQVGVAMVHSAAGLGHALGSLYTAWRNQTPLVVLAGQQTRALLAHEPYLFAQSAAEFPQPYVKFSIEPATAQDVPAAIAQALYIARQAPAGPAFVSIPEDDWDQPAEPLVARALSGTASASPADLSRIAAALEGASRPALVLGAEVEADGGRAAAVALAEKLGADVLVAPLSGRCSFPEDHPQFAGFLQPVAEQLRVVLGKYDLVLVVGAPVFTLHVHTPGPVVLGSTALFHITANPRQAAQAMAGESVVAAPRQALELLTGMVAGVPRTRPTKEGAAAAPPAMSMSPEYVLHTLSGLLPKDAVVVEEAPTHRNAMHNHLPIRNGQRFHVAASGGLGWAMPAAVGMALADPGATVVCIIGDGSSLYSIQALWTAAQRGANVMFAVLNNSGYAAMKAFGRRLGVLDAPGLDLPDIDLTLLAQGFGVPAEQVTEASNVAGTLEKGLLLQGPMLLDIRVGPAEGELY